jgi:hypothetical protein
MRERSEILKSKSEVMGGGGGLGRLPADRLGRAASMEASGAVAAAANNGAAREASHAASPEGLDDAAWFFSLIDFCLLAPQLICFVVPFTPPPDIFCPSVLRIRDAYPGSWIRSFSIPDPGSEFFHPGSRIPDPHQRI